jgi:hypothetical protein
MLAILAACLSDSCRQSQIKELEDEVTRCRAANEQLNSELYRKQEKLAKLEDDLRSVTAAVTPMQQQQQQPHAAVGLEELSELERLLDAELAKSVQLEHNLSATTEREVAAAQRALAAEGSAREARAEHERQMRTVQLQLDAAQHDIQVPHGKPHGIFTYLMENLMEYLLTSWNTSWNISCKQQQSSLICSSCTNYICLLSSQIAQVECAEKVRAAELSAMLEKRKRETEQELYR